MNLLLVGNHFTDQIHNRNVWQDLALHLRSAGHMVITTSGQGNKGLRLLDMLVTIWSRRREYQVAQVDVFSGQAFSWAYLSVKLLKRIQKPVILTLHGGNLPEYALHHPDRVRHLLRAADAVTAPSQYLLTSMRSYRDNIVLIPNALDTNHYQYIVRKSPRPVLIWLRAFHRIYNPELAVRVVALLQESVPQIHLIMVGPDKGDGSFQLTRQLAVQLGLEQKVEFPGKIPKTDVPKWLNKGDIFINTTNFDTAPISVTEAMVCGMCVVSTNVGGIPYLLKDEENALLVPPDDPEAMAAAVKRILSEPELAAKLSGNARHKSANL